MPRPAVSLIRLVCVALLALAAGCAKHVVKPPTADFGTIRPCGYLKGMRASVEVTVPKSRRIYTGLFEAFEVEGLSGSLQERIGAAAQAFGMTIDSGGLRLVATITDFRVQPDVSVVAGTLQIEDSMGAILHTDRLTGMGGGFESSETAGAGIVFDVFDRAVSDWFARLDDALANTPELVALLNCP